MAVLLTLLQVADLYSKNLYPANCIYNMDETGFDLASKQRTWKVAPKGWKSKAQAR